MIKSKFLTRSTATLVVASILGGCSESDPGIISGGDTVRLTVNLPATLTRAHGDGSTATTLKCLVYTKATETNPGELVEIIDQSKITKSTTDGQFNVETQLASNVDYNLVFFAYAPTAAATDDTPAWKSPYTINPDNGTITVDYTKMTPNDERADAFFAHYEFTPGVTNPSTITLTRPMAQLNLATTDRNLTVVENAYGANLVTSVDFKAYTTLDLRNGAVGGEMEQAFSTAPTKAPDAALNPSLITPAPILTNVVYVLAPEGTKYPTDVTFKAYNVAATNITASTEPLVNTSIPAVPLQRNFRTNIYGALLTQQTDFTVEISAGFADSDFNRRADIVYVKAATASAITEALSSSTYDAEITLTQPITESINIPASTSSKGRIIKIDLQGQAVPNLTVGEGNVLNIVDTSSPATPAAAKARVQRRTLAAGADITVAAKATANIYASNAVFQNVTADGGVINIHGGIYYNPSTIRVINTLNGGAVNVFNGRFRGDHRDGNPSPLASANLRGHWEYETLSFHGIAGPWTLVEPIWSPRAEDRSTTPPTYFESTTEGLTWTRLGVARWKDPWLQPKLEADWGYSLQELLAYMERCNEYPTLYRLVDPYRLARELWGLPDSWDAKSDNGAIVFEMKDPSCVLFIPTIYSGLKRPSGFGKTYPYNFAGDYFYYNQHLTVDQMRNDGGVQFAYYDKAQNAIIMDSSLYVIGISGDVKCGTQYKSGLISRGYIRLPQGFQLLDVNGNEVK